MTLIEVLLALGLFMVLAAFVMGVLSTVTGLWSAGERRGRAELVFTAAVERLRADLAALHNGPRGWLVLDDWEVLAADEERPAWRLPRLRFLADGGALPIDDPEGRSAVELAWLLVPEDARGSRLCRLVRLSRTADDEGSFFDDAFLTATVRAGEGMTLLDGVAFADFEAHSAAGGRARAAAVPADTPADFPAQLSLRLEVVGSNQRTRPNRLDAGIGKAATAVTVRGAAPSSLPEFALLEKEWVQVSGNFPGLTLGARGARGTAAEDHADGAEILFPEVSESRFRVSAGGRRLLP